MVWLTLIWTEKAKKGSRKSVGRFGNREEGALQNMKKSAKPMVIT